MQREAAAMLVFFMLSAPALAASSGPGGARQPDAAGQGGRSTRGKILGVVIGAAGGFALGLVLGLDRFDDAIDSDRKVWTAAVAGAAGGAAAGYFIGKALSLDTTVPAVPSGRALREPPNLTLPHFPAPPAEPHRSFRSLFAP